MPPGRVFGLLGTALRGLRQLERFQAGFLFRFDFAFPCHVVHLALQGSPKRGQRGTWTRSSDFQALDRIVSRIVARGGLSEVTANVQERACGRGKTAEVGALATNVDTKLRANDREGRSSNVAALTQMIREAQSRGLLREGNPAALAHVFSGLLWGDLFARLLLRVEKTPNEKEIARRARDATATFLILYG